MKRWFKELMSPKTFLRFAYFRLLTNIYRRRKYVPDSIFNREWDTLIVLDACRFDLFEKIVGNTESLSKIKSPGSSTPEWLEGNFKEADLSDVVYISGNPFSGKKEFLKIWENSGLCRLIDVWKTDWDEIEGTVMPKALNKKVLGSIVNYPGKKMIIHYMQPHYPFVGKIRIKASGMIQETFFENKIRDDFSVWYHLEKGNIAKNEAKIAYASNLIFVLKYINKILPYLPGKVCVTSDHGNVFGKYGVFFGHPPRTYIPELIEVPWFEVPDKKKFKFIFG